MSLAAAIVIPVYNHEKTVAEVLRKAVKKGLPVIVVDDGSTDATFSEIESVKGVKILRHEVNLGKGAAIRTGFAEAMGYARWAVTLDADGQHDPEDLDRLFEAVPDKTRPIVVGARTEMTGKNVPWTSRFGRNFSNFWVRTSGGPDICDTQSGFRLYPLPEAFDLAVSSRRFQFEVEILVRAKWKGLPVITAPVTVTYDENRISHFRPFRDFLRNSGTFSRLIFQRVVFPRKKRMKKA